MGTCIFPSHPTRLLELGASSAEICKITDRYSATELTSYQINRLLHYLPGNQTTSYTQSMRIISTTIIVNCTFIYIMKWINWCMPCIVYGTVEGFVSWF